MRGESLTVLVHGEGLAVERSVPHIVVADPTSRLLGEAVHTAHLLVEAGRTASLLVVVELPPGEDREDEGFPPLGELKVSGLYLDINPISRCTKEEDMQT